MLLEIACFTLDGVINANDAGADRIELCENPADGGTTPSFGTLKWTAENITRPVFPIIRPRGGHFVYKKAEFETMFKDIQLCKDLGYQGCVTGILTSDGTIDTGRMSQLVKLAWPMEITFHRAFDHTINLLDSLNRVIEIGCKRILSSGNRSDATNGISNLKLLVEKADGRIIIMPGGGIRSSNLRQLAIETGAQEFHSGARIASNAGWQPDSQASDFYSTVDKSEVEKLKGILAELTTAEKP